MQSEAKTDVAPTLRKKKSAAKPTPKPQKSEKPLPRPALAERISWRPTPEQIVVASLVLLLLFRPFLVLGVLFVGLLLICGLFLALGYDGFWLTAMRLARWHAARQPEKAAALHRRIDAFAMRWDAVLDRFPEGSVDGLYLPDFGELARSETGEDPILDRRLQALRDTQN
jgi:hypothetical protein